MRTLLAILASMTLLVPTAAATGHLVNVGVGTFSLTYGANVFGGSGDTLDVGLMNAQCSDESDVVDVGIMNTEGGMACTERDSCENAEGTDPLGTIFANNLFGPGGEPTSSSCSDDGDTLDVSVLSTEGSNNHTCGEQSCWETFEGDAGDGTDIAIGGVEYGDDADGNDVGVANCEYFDEADSTDVGVVNTEWYDNGDTFDLSLFNNEWYDSGDANGLNVGGPGGYAIGLDCHVVRIVLPVGPGSALLP